MSDDWVQRRPLRELKGQSAEWHEGEGGGRLADRQAVLTYVETLGGDLMEDCLALYVTDDLRLLASYGVARGSSGALPERKLIAEGKRLGAAGFLLVEPKSNRVRTRDHSLLGEASRLRSVTRELDIPLLDYLVIEGSEILSAGGVRG